MNCLTFRQTQIYLVHVTVVARVKNNKVDGVYRIYITPGITNILQIDELTEKTTDDEVAYYFNFEADSDTDEDGILDGFARATNIRYIDNNGDGKCDIVLSWTYKYAKVSSIEFDERQLSVQFSVYGSDNKLNVEDYSGLSLVEEGDRIVYLERNSSMKKGIVKKLKPIREAFTVLIRNTYF